MSDWCISCGEDIDEATYIPTLNAWMCPHCKELNPNYNGSPTIPDIFLTEYAGLKKALNTSSPNGNSPNLANVPVAPQVKEGQPTSAKICPESAVSDQDGAKPSFSVQSFDRKSPDSEPAFSGREGGKPSTSPIVVHDVETVRSVAGHIRMKLIEQGLTDEKLKEVFDSLDKDSFSSGKGESGSVTANASGNHSAAYQQGGLTEPDENGGKSGGESASVQPTSFTATSVSPRPEEPCEVCGSDCVCCCPVCKIGPPTPPYCDHHIHCMCHPEHSKVYHLGRKHERSKVLDEVEAKIKAIPLYAKDAKVQDYSAGYANAHDSLKRKVIDLLGAMRK